MVYLIIGVVMVVPATSQARNQRMNNGTWFDLRLPYADQGYVELMMPILWVNYLVVVETKEKKAAEPKAHLLHPRRILLHQKTKKGRMALEKVEFCLDLPNPIRRVEHIISPVGLLEVKTVRRNIVHVIVYFCYGFGYASHKQWNNFTSTCVGA